MEKFRFCELYNMSGCYYSLQEHHTFGRYIDNGRCLDYYRAADVDAELENAKKYMIELSKTVTKVSNERAAMLAAARALVDTSKTARTFLRSFGQHKLADRVDQAIAAVEAIISPQRSSPPPAGNGKA